MPAFPLVHITWALPQEDRKACDAFFMDVFGARSVFELLVTPENAAMGYDREESLLLIGDSMLIPVAPAGGGALQGSPIGDMLRRAAKPGMWLGISLRAADLASADAWLRERGIVPHYDPGEEDHYCIVRRKETLGVRVELMTVDIPGDPRLLPDWSSSWWRDEHPLGIEGLQSIGVSVDSLEVARDVFAGKWGWPEIAERYLENDQANAVAFLMGDCVIEAMQPDDGASRLAQHAKDVKGIYCLTYKVRSAQKAADYLRGKGFALEGDTASRFAIDPAQAFGRLIYFAEDAPAGYPAVGDARPRIAASFAN